MRSLFSALKSENFGAACGDYTSSTQSAIITGAKKVSLEERDPLQSGVTCAEGLKFLTNLTPETTRATAGLGTPKFAQVQVNGDTAVVTYSASDINGLVGHSTVTLQQTSGRWLADKATSLTFTHN